MAGGVLYKHLIDRGFVLEWIVNRFRAGVLVAYDVRLNDMGLGGQYLMRL